MWILLHHFLIHVQRYLPQVVFWKWITPNTLGLVTQTAVYHWFIEGEESHTVDSLLEYLVYF